MKKTSAKIVTVSGILIAVSIAFSMLSNLCGLLWTSQIYSNFSLSTSDSIISILRNVIYDILSYVPAVLLLLYVFDFYKKGKMYVLIPIYFMYQALATLYSIVTGASSVLEILKNSYNIKANLVYLTLYFTNLLSIGFLIFIIVISFRRFAAKWHKIVFYVWILFSVSTNIIVAFNSLYIIITGAYGFVPGSSYVYYVSQSLAGCCSSLIMLTALGLLITFADFKGIADVPAEYSKEDQLKVLQLQYESGEISEAEYAARCEQVNKD